MNSRKIAPAALAEAAEYAQVVSWALRLTGAPDDLRDRTRAMQALTEASLEVARSAHVLDSEVVKKVLDTLNEALSYLASVQPELWLAYCLALDPLPPARPNAALAAWPEEDSVPIKATVEGRTAYVWARAGVRVAHRDRASIFSGADDAASTRQEAYIRAVKGRRISVDLVDGAGLAVGIDELWDAQELELAPSANIADLPRARLGDLERFGLT